MEREMAARAEAARRKRRLQARIGGGVAAAVVLAATIWIITAAIGGDPEPTAAPSGCDWPTDSTAFDPSASSLLREGIQDVGLPPTDPPQSGFRVLTLETNVGTVKIEMDLSKTPCTAANLAHLAEKKFYDGSSCHRMVPSIFALQCGDPSGTGGGGVTYKVRDENLPSGQPPYYREGDVAMANTGQPSTNGTQFFFLFGDSDLEPKYSLFGRVIEGMDVVKKVAAAGHDGGESGEGKPKQAFQFKTVTVSEVLPQSQAQPTTPPATPSPTGAPSPTASASASI
jgi:peptidyl-prolyl cis-trans isomerase B (cyclophilin B)